MYNKEINKNTENVMEQNKKIYEIDGKVDEVNDKMKITDKYINGFSSVFGFFSNLFNKKNKKKKGEKNMEIEGRNINGNKSISDDDEDGSQMKEEAKKLREEVKKSLQATQKLENKIIKTNENLSEIKKKTESVIKK